MKLLRPAMLLLVLALTEQMLAQESKVPQENDRMYVGTYTKKEGHVDGKAEGIYVLYGDLQQGQLKFGETVAEVTNPSYIKTSSDGEYLYAVSELGPGDAASGFLYSYKILEDDSLKQLGKLSSGGFAPCHIAMDQTGQFIFVSNYSGGVVRIFNRREDGSAEFFQELRMEDPDNSHPHSVAVSADNRHFYIADLGHDKIWMYQLNAEESSIEPHRQKFLALPDGSGPRHMSLSADGAFAYVINELNSSVSVLKIEPDGSLEILQHISALPPDYTDWNASADIRLHPSGKFLYVSNRGHNSIAAFGIHPEEGSLTQIGFTPTGGRTPRNFRIAPGGAFLFVANQDSNEISIFPIDLQHGSLGPLREKLKVRTPVSLEWPTQF